MTESLPEHPGDVAGDEELVARAREGDEEAFAELVRRYEGVVAATVIGMLGPGGDADDVGQEVFVSLWRSLESFRGDSSLKTYITRIAMNESISAIRKRQTWRRYFRSRDREPEEAPLPEPATSGQRPIAAREAERLVHGALLRLPEERRSVVVLRHIQGYSTRETAEILDVPEGTVMSRLYRAMDDLEEILRPHGRSGDGDEEPEDDDA